MLCRVPLHGGAQWPRCSSQIRSILPSEQSYRSFTCTILKFLDGTPRFAESVTVLLISTGTSSYKQYIPVVLLKAAHTNVCSQVIYQSLMLTYESLQQRPMVKLCLDYA